MRAPALPSWLRRSGLADVRQCTTLIERGALFEPVCCDTWWGLFHHLAGNAAELGLHVADQEFGAQFGHRGAFEGYLNNPDCWLVEANILALGTVPSASGTAR